MKVAIIGAGPAGLAMAYELVKNNISVSIYEKDKVVGGLAKSVWLWHARTELGPHFIGDNMNPDAKVFMQEIFDAVPMHYYERMSRIHLDRSFFDYPPNGINIIKNLGAVACCKAALSFIARSKNVDASDVATFVKSTFGAFMFNRFFKEYTEKLWGKPCSEIDAIFFKNLIGFKGNSIVKKMVNLFTKNNTVTYKKSYYPEEGFSMLWEVMQQKIEAGGGTFYFSAGPKRLVADGKRLTGVEMADGSIEQYDWVVSTIPEALLVPMLPEVPAQVTAALGGIRYRSLVCVFLLLDHCNLVVDNTVYLYSRALAAARITNFNRFRNIDGNDIVMLEYWTSEKEATWQLDDGALERLAKNDLMAFAATDQITVKDTRVVRLKNAYEIPDLAFQQIKREVNGFLQQVDGLITAGRASQHNFNYGMGDAIADGYHKAKKLVQKAEVNAAVA